MKLNRRNLTLGLAGIGLIGTVAGGVGLAQAAGPATTTGTTSAAVTAGPCLVGQPGAMAGHAVPMAAAAKYLGLSLDDLWSGLRSGKSLADISKAQGKSVAGIEDAMIAAMKKNLDANTTLTAEQKADLLARMKSRLEAMVTMTHLSGRHAGMMGGGMMGSGIVRMW